MTLTQKESSLLSDLKSQEQLCIEKYGKYSNEARDPALKNLFSEILTNEQKHLDTVNSILAGTEVTMPAASPSAVSAKKSFTASGKAERLLSLQGRAGYGKARFLGLRRQRL